MSRRHITFDCEGSALVGTLDLPDGDAASTGLLVVSGGNEVRSGAWNGHARLAARIAGEGFAVLRYDRRGVGDSEGPNLGYRASARDIAAALATFRTECPGLERIAALGNCDAASALMLTGGAGCDALLLSNPWTLDDADAPPPAAVVRDHYRRRLTDPAALRRLLTGQVSLGKLLASLRDAIRPAPRQLDGMARELDAGLTDAGLAGFAGPVRFLLAGRDRTAQAFGASWHQGDARIRTCAQATHSFVEPEAREWLAGEVLEMLRG